MPNALVVPMQAAARIRPTLDLQREGAVAQRMKSATGPHYDDQLRWSLLRCAVAAGAAYCSPVLTCDPCSATPHKLFDCGNLRHSKATKNTITP